MRLRIRYNIMEGNIRYKKVGEAEAWFIGCEGYTEKMILMNEIGKIFSIERMHIISGKWIKDDALVSAPEVNSKQGRNYGK
jgi:hypothetical protein